MQIGDRSGLAAGQGLRQIGNEIVGILDSDREPYRPGPDRRPEPLLGRQVTRLLHFRRDYQRFRRAEARRDRKSVSASANRLPAASPPAMSKLTMLPKSSI